MGEHLLSPTEINEIQNHDDFIVVWFGSYKYIPKELTNFSDYVKTFYSFETCDDYILKIRSEQKILMVFTDFYEYLSYFNDFPQVHSIYILDKNLQNLRYQNEKYSKLINIYTDERKLIEKLRQDILLTYRNDLPISISCLEDMQTQQSLINMNKNMTLFIWNQLFIYYLINAPDIDMNKLKKDMIDQCQLEVKGDKKEQSVLTKIDEFDKVSTCDNVLEWYTNDSFVYRLVNKAFRTRDIDLICKFRYFIILLNNKLKKLWIDQQGKNYTTVYRGQMMNRNELKNLQSNVGHLILTNTPMSTTRNQNVARIFLGDKTKINVLFEINISNAHNNKIYPFADISRFSTFPEEEETLFFPGVVFHIDSVKKENDSTWIIKLTLTNETVETMEQLMNSFGQIITIGIQYRDISEKTDDYSLFNRYHQYLTKYSFKDIGKIAQINVPYLIHIAGNYEKAIEYYKQFLINKNFIDHSKLIVLNILIGKNYFHLKQWNDAFDHYAIARSLLDENNQLTGALHNHIGDVWNEINDLKSALSCYKEAIRMFTIHKENKNIPEICQKIIDIYLKQNNSKDALIYANQIKQINQDYITTSKFFDNEILLRQNRNQLHIKVNPEQLQYAQMLYANGMHLIRKSRFSQGLESLLKAERLFKENLSFYNNIINKLAKLYESAAFAYFCLKDNFNALVMWRKAINIRTTFNSNPSFTELY